MADENELYMFEMIRPKRGERPPKRRVVEEMTTLELARWLREGES